MGQWKHVFDFRVSCGLKVDVTVSFSCIAVTVTAQLYQRSRLLLETHWKEEHCDISRYVLIMSLSPCACTGFFVVYLSCLCVSSSRTAPPWPSSRRAPPWTWSWISRPAGPVRGSWWRSWAPWESWSCDWRSRRPGRPPSSPTGRWGTSAFDACSERPRDRWGKPSGLQLPYKYASPSSVWQFFAALQANQSKQEQRQEEAAERRLRKASKEVLQMRGQSQKEPLPVQTFRWEMHWSVFILLVTAPKSRKITVPVSRGCTSG